jgi:uncharacterized protein (TIGR02246 family)
MSRSVSLSLVAVFAVGGLVGWLATSNGGPFAMAQPKTSEPKTPDQPSAKAAGAEAGIKAITVEYVKAFNAADAKAAAALWTENGEYTDADGEVINGRSEIEKSLAAHFKTHPKATAEIRVESVRIMGRGLAMAEGVVTIKMPGDEPPTESRYSALHVLDDGKWLAASVREWVPDPATDVTPKHLEWLVGEWVAKVDGGVVKIVYAWDEDKVFLTGNYTVTKDGKTISSGKQIFGPNPSGGLRSWTFDSSGKTSDGTWVRDEDRWINEAEGVLLDGTEIKTVNVLIPLGHDAFTWQTTEREIDGNPVAGLPPVKVTRVGK